ECNIATTLCAAFCGDLTPCQAFKTVGFNFVTEWLVGYRISCTPTAPRDPNEKLGPLGYGAEALVGLQDPLRYTVYFENISSASAAAQRIRVTDQLDPALDPRTL